MELLPPEHTFIVCNMETKKTLKKILASIAIMVVFFSVVVTSANVLNSSADNYNNALAAISIVGNICLSFAIFKRM